MTAQATSAPTPSAREDAIVADLTVVEDPRELLTLIVERAVPARTVPEAKRLEDNRVRGCVSAVWVEGEAQDGRMRWWTAADSPLVGALVALVAEVYEGVSPESARDFETTILNRLGLTGVISPTRLDGLAAVRRRLRAIANAQVLAVPPGPHCD